MSNDKQANRKSLIKRTDHANTPKGAAWVRDIWGEGESPFADTFHEGDFPTHSPVLGPDGRQLQYEARPLMGFDLRKRGGPVAIESRSRDRQGKDV